MVAEQTNQGEVVYVLQPNCSLSWQGNKRFLAWMSVVSLSIAAWFAWLGAWMVFPFAGIELAVLTYALYLVSCRSLDREEILVSGDSIEVCKGRRRTESVICLQRHWAQVSLEAAPHAWYPSRLMIRSHGRETEIGGFLEESERQQLAQELKRVV